MLEKERIKMTEREMLNAVIAGKIDEEVIAKAQAMIDAKNDANAKRREKESVKAQENKALAQKLIGEVLTKEGMTATQIAEAMGLANSQKATAIAKKAVEIAEGAVIVEDVKITGKGKQKAYRLA